jgi:aryl-alcohol dehydrogenase-like predicted oxidoreductase
MMPEPNVPDKPRLLLGTAMWGWTTPRETAFQLLGEWYRRGFRAVDTATNYPIDKVPAHFRLAEQILLEWIKAHGVNDLEVMMKTGSVNNLRTPEHLLTKSFLLMMLDEYKWMFGTNLSTLMVHWDNRGDAAAVEETLEGLDFVRKAGFRVGLSGIRHPEIYLMLNARFDLDFSIQIKHNPLHSDYKKYALFHGTRRFIAYGINAGGLKLRPEEYSPKGCLQARGGDPATPPDILRKLKAIVVKGNENTRRPKLEAMHQLGLISAYYQPDMAGILTGPSNLAQLAATVDFYQVLPEAGYDDIYNELKQLQPK